MKFGLSFLIVIISGYFMSTFVNSIIIDDETEWQATEIVIRILVGLVILMTLNWFFSSKFKIVRKDA